MSEKFEEERHFVLEQIQNGIESNIPLSSLQNKYVKNLLLYALMNASNNESVTGKNFVKLVNKLFKKYLVKIFKDILDDDDTDFDGALDVDLNKLAANPELIDLQALAQNLSPSQIIAFIKANTNGISQKQLLDKLMTLRDLKTNHRETPAEQKQRENRQKEYELARQRERMMDGRIMTRGSRSGG